MGKGVGGEFLDSLWKIKMSPRHQKLLKVRLG